MTQRIVQDNETVNRLVKVLLSEGQRIALLSFQFNTGD